MQQLIVATGNKGKFREIDEILSKFDLEMSCLSDHWQPKPEIPETGDTFTDNALIKARWVFSRKGIWTLGDDSGLEVDYLGGRPGVYSARYAGEGATDLMNLEKLLDELKGVPREKRTARFCCVMVLMIGADTWHISEGRCEGWIGFTPYGDKGFGYDPVFIPDGFTKTFAEISSEEKHEISHRGRALDQLKKYLGTLV